MIFVIGLWSFLRALCLDPAAVALENLALRHQLLVLQQCVTRPRLSRRDRILWVWLSRPWRGGVAVQSPHRPARDRPRLAPPRLPALLAVEVQPAPCRAAEARRRDASPDPPDGAGKSDL